MSRTLTPETSTVPPSSRVRNAAGQHFLPAALIGLAALEAASSWLRGSVTILAGWTWLLLSLFVLGISALRFISAVRDAIRSHAWASGIANVGVVVLCFWGIEGYRFCSINYESALQLAAGVANASQADLGHHELAFLMYPARQYTLAALPAVVWGPSLLTLRLGYALFFFLGWSTFRAGWRQWFEHSGTDSRTAQNMAGIFSAALLTFPIAVHWIRAFEQTLIPISLTCFAVGFALEWVSLRRASSFVGLAWAGAFLGTSYSPSLAVWALGLVVVAYALIMPKLGRSLQPLSRMQVGALMLFMLAHGVSNLIVARNAYQDSFTLRSEGDSSALLSAAETGARLAGGFTGLFTDTRTPFFHGVLWWPLAFTAGWLVFNSRARRNWRIWALFAWCVGVIAASVVFRGYVRHPPEFDLHRAMVVIPFLALGMAAALRHWVEGQSERTKGLLSLGLACTTVWLTVRAKDIWGTERYEPQLNEDLVKVAAEFGAAHPQGAAIYLAPHLMLGGNLRDYLQFLSPSTAVQFGENPAADLSQAKIPTLGVFRESDPFLDELRKRGSQVKPLRRFAREAPGTEPFMTVDLNPGS